MDEVCLSSNASSSNTIKLPLANYVDSFVYPEGSLSTLKVLEMLAGFDSPSDKSVLLLHYVLKILYGAMLAALWQSTRLFQFCYRFDIAAIFVSIDDSRRLNVLSL